MEKEQLERGYALLNGYVESMGQENSERNYLLELQQWFFDAMKSMDKSDDGSQTD